MKNWKWILFTIIASVIIIFSVNMAFAAETYEISKVDDYHAKVKTTNVEENTYTLPEIDKKIETHVTSKQSWVDDKTASDLRAEEGILLHDTEKAKWEAYKADCATIEVCAPGDWVTETDYAESICVTGPDGVMYKCLVGHVSGVFVDDLAEGKWEACV